jgi:hypothetical protein
MRNCSLSSLKFSGGLNLLSFWIICAGRNIAINPAKYTAVKP